MVDYAFPWQDVSAILLADGWHRPLPGTIWDVDARMLVRHNEDGVGSGGYLIHNPSQELSNVGEVPCVVWDEVNTTTGSVENVIVKLRAINGFRTQSTDTLDDVRAAELRGFIFRCKNGNYPMTSYSVDEVGRNQAMLRILRQRNPRIAEDPLDTWSPTPI
jgi:hypothetical protein